MSQRATPTLIPSQPARLQLGDREIPIPTQPLSRESRRRRQIELLTDDPQCLVLMPRPASAWVEWLLGPMMLGSGAFLCAMGLMAIIRGGWWGLIFLFGSVPFLGILVLVAKSILFGKAHPRFRFARRKGELVIDRRQGLRKGYQVEATRALTDIVAIQLLYSGYHSIVHTSDSGPSSSEQFYTYEMNVLFGDAQQSRLHLCTHSDWEWMRGAGQKLGEFLGVQVVDQLRHGA